MIAMRMVASSCRRAAACCGMSFALASIGCVVESNGAPPPPVGQLTLRWTVDENVDPNACIMGQAAAIDIVLTTTDGQPAGEYQSACSNFSTSVSTLAPGDYVGSARLIDGAGTPRTTAVHLSPFTIISGSPLVVDVDFPASSFL